LILVHPLAGGDLNEPEFDPGLAISLAHYPKSHDRAKELAAVSTGSIFRTIRDIDRWRQMMLDLRNVGLISASSRVTEHDDLPAPDFPSKPETQPDNMCSHEQMRSVLGVAMKTLPERHQKVVFLYYTNEMTMKEIGAILGVNESRVSQIHKSALVKMQVVLQSNGIHSVQAF
jgi:RNA polymerase sigma factor (sigma-70 family)